MQLIEPLRKVNRYVKEWRKGRMGLVLSPVRRIERVYPPAGKLVVGMTFDDGPTVSPARPGDGRGLTESLLAVLAKYGAHATFDVVGTTADNYPDTEGKLGTALWSGVKFDHYPEFGKDELAGVVNQKALTKRLLAEGHELSNHGYNHVAFGPSRIVYGARSHLKHSEAVYQDLKRLHDLVQAELGFTMRLARPPHYIDRIPDGKNSYDVYARLGYNYMAASFDGGGWKPSSGSYRADVEAMVAALRRALEQDPKSLNGQIIFQKDGYNMSKESPIVDALPLQLELLRQYGYEVVTVSELLNLSPFTDVPAAAPCFDAVLALARAGYVIGFRDNSFKPEKVLTQRELAALLAGPQRATPTSAAAAPTASARPFPVTSPDKPVTGARLEAALGYRFAMLEEVPAGVAVTRGIAALAVASAFGLVEPQ